jgi:hypothetical protein
VTSAADRRLKRVEDALYPTEAMALWLQEAKEQHRSLEELVADLRAQPEEAWPLFQLTHQAEAAARGRLKRTASLYTGVQWQRAEVLERGKRAAVRDAATLWFLFVEANSQLMAEKRALWLVLALLNSLIGNWVHQKFRELDEPLDRRIASCLEELYAWQGAIAALSASYFEGVNPLMPEMEEHLGQMLDQGESLAERFNDAVEIEAVVRKGSKKPTPNLPTPIDVAVVRAGADAAVQARVCMLVDMARAEAYEMMGERNQALALAERHL